MSGEGRRPGGLLANATVTSAADGARVRRLDGSDGAPSAAGTQSKDGAGGGKKIQLAAGYSQMDWMRLTKRTPDMNGLDGGKRRKDITMEEVATHGTEADGWTVLRGKVYNLSPYLDFHPGGRKILTQSLGKDCTALFESYHLRSEVAAARFKMLPALDGFPVAAVPRTMLLRRWPQWLMLGCWQRQHLLYWSIRPHAG